MNEILYDSEEFNSDEGCCNFMEENDGYGTLKVQVATSNEAYPLSGVEITITKFIDGKEVIFFKGLTNESGIIDNIRLPAIPTKEEILKESDIVYTVYNLKANYPKNNFEKMYDVSIFDNIKVIQPIRIPISMIEGDLNEQ